MSILPQIEAFANPSPVPTGAVRPPSYSQPSKFLSREQVRQIIANAPAGATPQGIIAGLRQRGVAMEGYDATFATSQTPKNIMDTFSEGVGKLYSEFSNLSALRPLEENVGRAVGNLGAIISAPVTLLGATALEGYKAATGGRFDASNIEKAMTERPSKQENVAMGSAASFGQEIGRQAVPAALTSGLGKAAQVILGVSMTYEGQKNLFEGIGSGNDKQAAEGMVQLIPGFLGLKSSIGSALGDVKAGFTPKVPGEKVGFAEGATTAARNLSKDLLIAPELKNQVSREYRYLRYGEEAPVLGAGDIRTLNSAIKPSKSKLTLPQWSKDLETTIHSVSDSLPENPTIVDLDTAIKNAKASTWADVKDSIRKGDEAKLALDGDAIASAIRERKNDPRMQLENVKYVRDAITGDMVRAETGPLREIEELAKAYEGKNIDFLSGEAVLESLNAESQMYYKKNMTSRSIAERADPVLAAKLDLAAEIRKQQDALLESIDVSGFKGLKRKYGALRNVGEEVQNRMFMDSKLQMSSLAQKIAAGRQAAQMIYGAATGNPAAALSGIADKVLTDYVKSLDEASSKIGRVFDSVRRNKELNAMPSILESAKNIKPGLTVEDVSQRPKNIAIDMGKQVLPKLTIESVPVIQQTSILPTSPFKGLKGLSTRIIEKLKGKTSVSRQYIEDLAKSQDVRKTEKELIDRILSTIKGDKIDVAMFAEKISAELLPLKRRVSSNLSEHEITSRSQFTPRYENIVTLPAEIRGNVKNYSEVIYESPVTTVAGNTHFDGITKKYFGHTRIEDMADGTTRRIIEVQSDLYQKGGMASEISARVKNGSWLSSFAPKYAGKKLSDQDLLDIVRSTDSRQMTDAQAQKLADSMLTQFGGKSGIESALAEDMIKYDSARKELMPLEQYNDPTAHFRLVREEISRAAKDKKKELLFPTGETAMKIEKLGNSSQWHIPNPDENANESWLKLDPSSLKVGQEVNDAGYDEWIVTKVLGDGKFMAIPKYSIPTGWTLERFMADRLAPLRVQETFDASGNADTSNPIFKFYDKELGKFLKGRFNAKETTDKQGQTWWKVDISKEHGTQPVEALSMGKSSETIG